MVYLCYLENFLQFLKKKILIVCRLVYIKTTLKKMYLSISSAKSSVFSLIENGLGLSQYLRMIFSKILMTSVHRAYLWKILMFCVFGRKLFAAWLHFTRCICKWALLILQPFRCFTYVTARFPTIPSLYLRHSSFSRPPVASPTSQLILQPFFPFYSQALLNLQHFRHFTYVTAHSPTFPLLHLRHSSFSNPSFASPTSQALHLIHLASRPCPLVWRVCFNWSEFIINSYND